MFPNWRMVRAWWNKTFHSASRAAILRNAKMGVEENGEFWATMTYEKGEFAHFIAVMAQLFNQSGAVNYFEVAAYDEITMEAYTVSIQKRSGMTASNLNRIMRDALVRIIEMDRYLLDEYLVARDALTECGYLEDGIVVTTKRV